MVNYLAFSGKPCLLIILFIYYLVLFANHLLRIFISLFMSNTGLDFPILQYLYFVLFSG